MRYINRLFTYLLTYRWTDRRTDILRRHSPRYPWHRTVKMAEIQGGPKRRPHCLITHIHKTLDLLAIRLLRSLFRLSGYL